MARPGGGVVSTVSALSELNGLTKFNGLTGVLKYSASGLAFDGGAATSTSTGFFLIALALALAGGLAGAAPGVFWL